MATENKVSDDAYVPENEQVGAQPIIVTGTEDKTSSQSPNKRQFNPLSQFSSVTYNISFYALTPNAYNDFYTNDRWVINDNTPLIVQSGGVTTGTGAPRAPEFPLDLYIDDLEIESLLMSELTRFPSNVQELNFKIYEPYGMSFISRLVTLQQRLRNEASIKMQIENQLQLGNFPYLIVVRFYGYDESGNLVSQPADQGSASFTRTDSNASFERAFPVMFQNITYKLDGKTTVYNCKCRLINEKVGFSIRRGKVNEKLTIVADTVEAAIGGSESTQSATSGQQFVQNTNQSVLAATKSLTNGLIDQLNLYQEEQVRLGKQERKDVYKIVYDDNTIGKSLLVDSDFYTKEYAPIVDVTTADEVNIRTATIKATKVDKKKREISITGGTPISAAIEQIITQSTYLRDVMKAFDIEQTEKVQEQDEEAKIQNPTKPFTWFIIKPIVKILGWDSKRYDNAYEITYLVKKYQVPYLRSLVVNYKIPYYGPHKIYNYWYTGQNSEVLAYEVDFNFNFYNTQVMGTSVATTNGDLAPNAVEAATNTNPTNMLPGKKELQNQIISSLYSPADQLKATIKILGDPDFLMPTESGSLSQMLTKWYGPNYSINALGGQVFIEIGFNLVQDYDNGTGLLTVKDGSRMIKIWNYPDEIEKITNGRMIYQVTHVKSIFRNGTFIQELKSVIPPFTKSTTNNSAGKQFVNATNKSVINAITSQQTNNSPGFTQTTPVDTSVVYDDTEVTIIGVRNN